jgi:hypothetical protein
MGLISSDDPDQTVTYDYYQEKPYCASAIREKSSVDLKVCNGVYESSTATHMPSGWTNIAS